MNTSAARAATKQSPLRHRFGLLAVLAPVLLVALVVRLAGLERYSLWVDEGFTWEVARQGPNAIVTALATYDNHPPLHYLLLWAWMHLAGSSEYALRYLSAASGVATVALVGWLGRRLYGGAAGFIAAAFLALSPFHVWYSQEARSYALLAFLACASMAAFVQALAGNRRRHWVALAVLDALALYTHYYAAFVIAAQALTGLIVVTRTRRGGPSVGHHHPRVIPIHRAHAKASIAPTSLIRNGALALAGAALLFAPWLVAVYEQYGRAPHDYSPPLGLLTVVGNVASTFAGGEVGPAWGLPLVIGLVALAILGALSGCSVRLFGKLDGDRPSVGAGLVPAPPVPNSGRGDKPRAYRSVTFLGAAADNGATDSVLLPVLWLLAPILLPYLLAVIFRLDLRVAGRMYYIVALPAYCLLVGRGVVAAGVLVAGLSPFPRGEGGRGVRSALPGRGVGSAVSLLLALLVLAGSGAALANQRATRDKEDFRGVAAYIQAREWPGDTIVLNAEYTFRPFVYYYRGVATWHRAVMGDDARIDAALREQTVGASRVWVVLSHDGITDPRGKIRGWLHDHGVVVDEAWLNGVGVVCYSLETHPSYQPLNIGRPQALDFGGIARLTGADTPASVAAGQTMRLAFAWQALAPAREDYHAVALLEDSSGKVRAQIDKIPFSGEYQPTSWRAGEFLLDRMMLKAPVDLTPGDYRLRLFLYSPSSGKPLPTSAGDDRPIVATVTVK